MQAPQSAPTLVTPAAFPASTSTGGVIDAKLRGGTADHELDARAYLVALEVARETFDIESDPAREIDESRVIDRRLTVEEPVVHLEEAPLSTRRLRSSGS